MHAAIDATADLIAPYVYADDNKMYSDADFDTNLESDLTGGGGPMGGVTYGLKSFVSNRVAYVQSQLECQNTSSVDTWKASLSVHPNPATERLHIRWNGEYAATHLMLRNALGQRVLTTKVFGVSEATWDVENLPNGVYLSEVWASGKPMHQQKVLICH